MHQPATLRPQFPLFPLFPLFPHLPRFRLSGRYPRALALAASLLAFTQAHASWEVDTTDAAKVELVFMAWDNNGTTPKLAFMKDLGLTMSDFFTNAQKDSGAQFHWYLGGTGATADDATWTSFLTTDVTAGVKADPAKIKWAVFAMAQPGGTSGEPGAYRLYTTNSQGRSGSATTIPGLSALTSDTLTNTATAIGNLYTQSQTTGTLGSALNGSSLIKATDGVRFPFDSSSVGVGNNVTFGGNLQRDIGNLIGKSSWFYYLTGSDALDSSRPVIIDEFDNLGSDGYWGLAPAAEASKAGEYFLSYTIAAYVTPQEATSNIMAGNNFARLAGNLSLSSAAGKGSSVLNLTESFLRGFATAVRASGADDIGGPAYALAAAGADDSLTALSPVPESGTAGLFGLGLLVVAARTAAGTAARRRDARVAQGV